MTLLLKDICYSEYFLSNPEFYWVFTEGIKHKAISVAARPRLARWAEFPAHFCLSRI